MKLTIDLENASKTELLDAIRLMDRKIIDISKKEQSRPQNYCLEFHSDDTNNIKLIKVLFNEQLDTFGKAVPIKVILSKFSKTERKLAAKALEGMMEKGEIYMPYENFIARI